MSGACLEFFLELYERRNYVDTVRLNDQRNATLDGQMRWGVTHVHELENHAPG